jgi:hypothetical protein
MRHLALKNILVVFLFIFSFHDCCAITQGIIIKEKNIYFLSPHFDDVPLTFGGLILNGIFKEKNNNVIVFFGISSYTANGPINDDSDKHVVYVTNTRSSEDRAALTQLFNGWKNYKYSIYGERENTVRYFKGPKNAGGGPSGNFESFRPIEIDTFNNIYEEVIPILEKKDCAVFILSGIQSHIDHFILREAVIKAAHDLGDKAICQIYFGEDQPYAGDNQEITKRDIQYLSTRLHLEPITYPINSDNKIRVFINNYYSQYEDSYVTGLVNRAKELHGGERIYKWQRKYYKTASKDISCTKEFCEYNNF